MWISVMSDVVSARCSAVLMVFESPAQNTVTASACRIPHSTVQDATASKAIREGARIPISGKNVGPGKGMRHGGKTHRRRGRVRGGNALLPARDFYRSTPTGLGDRTRIARLRGCARNGIATLARVRGRARAT